MREKKGGEKLVHVSKYFILHLKHQSLGFWGILFSWGFFVLLNKLFQDII